MKTIGRNIWIQFLPALQKSKIADGVVSSSDLSIVG